MQGIGKYTSNDETYTGQFMNNCMHGIGKWYDKKSSLTVYVFCEN